MQNEQFLEEVRTFLAGSLPSERQHDLGFLRGAIAAAATRFDRYAANRQWEDFYDRRRRLDKIASDAGHLAEELVSLDVISRDDLADRIQPGRLDEIVGLLHLLRAEAKGLRENVQSDGRPRDLAEERWVHAIADIFEMAFREPAKLRGASENPKGKFFQLLKVSRPYSFARLQGKLSARQIRRHLTRRVSSQIGANKPREASRRAARDK
jgi:hypothetical protein